MELFWFSAESGVHFKTGGAPLQGKIAQGFWEKDARFRLF